VRDSKDQGTLARLTDRAKLALGKMYLDWAEMLPKFGGGFVARLQHIRERQRKHASESAVRCRLPEGFSFRYSLCVLTELFTLENLDALDKGVRALFPAGSLGSHLPDFIGTDAPGLADSSWWNVGVLVRESKFLPGPPTAKLETLPPEVEYISMQVQTLLPSALVACFCAFLNDRATSRLRQLIEATYLPTVRFQRWVPFGLFRGARSETSAESVRKDAVLGELLRIRVGIEHALGQFFQGYFFSRGESGTPKLPGIEVLDVVGMPSDSEQLWWGWGIPLGLDHGRIAFNGYREGNQIFVFSGAGRDDLPVAHSFLTLHDAPEGESVRDNRLTDLTEGLIGEIGEGLTLLGFLREIRSAVEDLRSRIYRRLAGKSFLVGFRADIRLHRRLQKESLLLNRLGLELAQHEKMSGAGPSGLSRFVALSKQLKERDLGKEVSNRIDFQLDTISKHLDFVSRSFSDYVSARNMDLTFRLQIQVYVLTALATLATVLPAISSNWFWIKAALHGILRVLGI